MVNKGAFAYNSPQPQEDWDEAVDNTDAVTEFENLNTQNQFAEQE